MGLLIGEKRQAQGLAIPAVDHARREVGPVEKDLSSDQQRGGRSRVGGRRFEAGAFNGLGGWVAGRRGKGELGGRG